jgi:type III secretion protein D
MALPTYELRVLSGPQKGASLLLKTGLPIDIGSLNAVGCQVVLRDPLINTQRLRLHVPAKGRMGQDNVLALEPLGCDAQGIRLHVLAGSIEMAGQTLDSPSLVGWPDFVPIKMGDTVLAIGPIQADPSAWAHALNLALMPCSKTLAPAAQNNRPPHTAAQRSVGLWLSIAGGTMTTAALALWVGSTLTSIPPLPTPSEEHRLAKVLSHASFRQLQSSPCPNPQPKLQWRCQLTSKKIIVHGDLLTQAEQAQLEQQLEQTQIDAHLQVRVAEKLQTAVADIYRMNAVTPTIVPNENLSDVGQIQVQTQERDEARLRQIEAIVRHDVVGLSRLQTHNTPPTTEPPPNPGVNDPAKRLASIVAGPTPYVVTADGARYFVGAMLPSGHRLASIANQQIMLEKNGQLTPLTF